MVESGNEMNLLGKMGRDGGISNVNQLPQITATFNGWESSLLLVRITQQIIDSIVTDIPHEYPFKGIVQPLSPKQIALKPEGERAWAWLQIHIRADSPLKLNVNDRIVYNKCKYKVMARNDYSANNYVELHAVQDFQAGGE